MALIAVLGGPVDPTFAGSNPAEEREISKGDKILGTTSFGGEVKPSTP
jgi:hypothetical protein